MVEKALQLVGIVLKKPRIEQHEMTAIQRTQVAFVLVAGLDEAFWCLAKLIGHHGIHCAPIEQRQVNVEIERFHAGLLMNNMNSFCGMGR